VKVLLVSVAVLAAAIPLTACCAHRQRDPGVYRRQGPTDPQEPAARMPGWPDGWVYERTVAAGTDSLGRPWRFTVGAFGATKAEAYCAAVCQDK